MNDAIPKYTTNDSASTIVVINGLAITAGSNPTFFAKSGSIHPTIFARITVNIMVRATTIAIIGVPPSIKITFSYVAIASTTPQIIATRNSFQIILNMSLNSISSRESPRITVTDD